MRWLWPIKTGRTLVDIWSCAHLSFFLVLGMNAEALGLRNRWGLLAALGGGLVIGLAWEVLETLLERMDAKREPASGKPMIKHPERWKNRWIGDPVVDVAGFAFGLWLAGHQ